MNIEIQFYKKINGQENRIIHFLNKKNISCSLSNRMENGVVLSVQPPKDAIIESFIHKLSVLIHVACGNDRIKIMNEKDKNIGKRLYCHTSSLQKNGGEFSFTKRKSYRIIEEDLLELYFKDDQGRTAHVCKYQGLAYHYFGNWFLVS